MTFSNNATDGYSASNYQVSTVAGQGNYSTIQFAIDSAVTNGSGSLNPIVVWIQSGYYTENLTLAPYVSLAGALDPSTGAGVSITGNAIYPDPSSGNLSITNIGFVTQNSSAALSFQSTRTSTIDLDSVFCDGAAGIGFECTGSGMTVNCKNISLKSASGGICKNISDGTVEFISSFSNFNGTPSTISGGILQLLACGETDAFVLSGSAELQAFDTVIQSSALACVDLGAAAAALMVNCSLASTNTYAISGTGTLEYANLVALQTGTPLDPGLTSVPLPTFTGQLDTSTLVTTYDLAQTGSTWTKSTNPPTKYIEVYMWSGGSGGGSGRMGSSGSSTGGGGGGCSGLYAQGPASYFPSSATVTVGGGGGGGASQTTPSSNGNNGLPGGSTSLGSLTTIAPTGGNGGNTGSPGPAVGGIGAFYGMLSIVGADGGSGSTGTGGITASTSFMQSTGGGGGSPLSISAVAGGTAGDSLSSLLAGGVGGIETGTINGGNGNDSTAGIGALVGGTGGGGGGGVNSGSTAGIGGNGGFPGGGGGGGGSGSILLSVSSGAGGAGGDGYMIIIEYF